MAGITDKLLSIGKRGTLTTLKSPGKAVGAESLKIEQSLNWPTDSKVAFSICSVYEGGENSGKEIPGTYTEWTGILNTEDGSIDNLHLEQGNDQDYSPGGNTRVMIHISVTVWEHLMSALRGIMNLDGSLKKSPVETALQVKPVDLIPDHVVAGTGLITVVSGLICSISDMTYYLGGVRYTKTGIPNKTFAATKDTYCFIDAAGTITYLEVANNAAAPTPPANSILFAWPSANGTTIQAVHLRNRTTEKVGLIKRVKNFIDVSQGATSSSIYNALPSFSCNMLAGYTYKISVELPSMSSDRTGQQTITLQMRDNNGTGGTLICSANLFFAGDGAFRSESMHLSGTYDATSTGEKTFYLRISTNPGSGFTTYSYGDIALLVECVGLTSESA